jgi:hypothetical protein
MVKLLVETEFRLRTVGFDPVVQAMTATLAGVGCYLNARHLICREEEVIADPSEIS